MPTGQRKFAREDGKYADFLDTNSGNLKPDGTAFIGSSNLAAPSDHIHPSGPILAAALAAAQSGGLTGAGYVGASGSPISGASPVAPLTKWTSGYLFGEWLFVIPSVTVNGYVSLAPWGGGALAGTYVALFNSAGTQLGITADLSAQGTNGRGIRVAATGFTQTPSNGQIFVVYTNATSASNAGPYIIQGQTYNTGYPTPTIPPGGLALASNYSTATTMPSSLTFGSNGVPSGWSDSSPLPFQAYLD